MPKKNIMLFLLAALSMNQIRVVGFIGVSEVILLFCGPFVFIKELKNLRRDNLMTFMFLLFLWLSSAIVTDVYRQVPITQALKGLATPLILLAMTPCVYSLLKDDVLAAKWAIVGFVVTNFLCTFVLQTGSNVGYAQTQGISAYEAALEYKLTYAFLITSAVSLLPVFFYLSSPRWSVLCAFCLAGVSLYFGGRSMFLSYLISAGMLVIVGGHREKIKRVSRHVATLITALFIFAWIAKNAYEYCASSGYMGDVEQQKYETQSNSRIGVWRSRSQFITTFFAIRDSPILGHGSHALDYNGYNLRTYELIDDEDAIRDCMINLTRIDTHSYIFTAYVWHGLLGATFWIYALWIIGYTCKNCLGVVPELYAYFALRFPALVWNILFSPYDRRMEFVFIMILCLLIRRKRLERPRVVLQQNHTF